MKRSAPWRITGMALWLATIALPAAGVTIHVRDYEDDFVVNGTCSLREAIRAANENIGIDACPAGSSTALDIIRVPAGVHSIDLTSGSGENAAATGDLDITEEVVIRGTTAEFTTVDGSGGVPIDRLIHVHDGAVEVELERMTLVGGRAVAPDGLGGVVLNEETGTGGLSLKELEIRGGEATRGGGVFNAGTLSIRESRVHGNKTVDDGASGNGGGGITSRGPGTHLSITDSEVSGNTADNDGGGIEAVGDGLILLRTRIVGNTAGGDGGGLYVADDLNIGYTEFSGNTASRGGGVFHLSNMGEMRQVSIVNNTGTLSGGGLHEEGMGIVRFSTIAGNSAPQGAGIYADSAMALFDSVTVARNLGVGADNQNGLIFEQSILAENTGGNCGTPPPGAGALNIDDANTCALPLDVGGLPNFPNTDPMLGTLALHGGPTPVIALLPGSPAIDAANSELRPNCEKDRDQRGRARGLPRSQNGAGDDVFHCDLGAFERTTPFIVDSWVDAVDADTADDVCATATGVCTLRAAIQQANAIPDLVEIELGPGTHTLSLPETGGEAALDGDLDIIAPIEIRGAGTGVTLVDGNGIDRVFHIHGIISISSVPLPSRQSLLMDLSITGGMVSSPDNGGGVLAELPARLERVELFANAADRGAAVSSDSSGFLSSTNARVHLVDTTVGNHTSRLALYGGDFRIEASTIRDNFLSAGEFLRVAVLNSTFSGNSGGNASAFFASEAVVDSSTFYDNNDPFSPAVFLLEQSSFRNTILANNLVGGVPDNCASNSNAIVSLGFNLTDDDGVACALFDPSDQLNADPLLGPLADNGGATLTHLPSAGSPAIDMGDDDQCPSRDQRGLPRPMDGDSSAGPACDVGAVEVVPEPGVLVSLLAGWGLIARLRRHDEAKRTPR